MLKQLTQPRVFEVNVGIMISCMPSLSSFVHHQNPDPLHIMRFKGFLARNCQRLLSLTLARGPSDESDNLRCSGESRPEQNYRLETGILGSAQGRGRFLQTNQSSVGDWLQITEGNNHGMSIVREQLE